MINTLSDIAHRINHRCATLTRLGVSRIARALRHGWSVHRSQITANRPYLAAVTALATSLVSQTSGRDLLAALIAGVLAVYAATQRQVRRRDDGWDDPYGVWARI